MLYFFSYRRLQERGFEGDVQRRRRRRQRPLDVGVFVGVDVGQRQAGDQQQRLVRRGQGVGDRQLRQVDERHFDDVVANVARQSVVLV